MVILLDPGHILGVHQAILVGRSNLMDFCLLKASMILATVVWFSCLNLVSIYSKKKTRSPSPEFALKLLHSRKSETVFERVPVLEGVEGEDNTEVVGDGFLGFLRWFWGLHAI